MSLKSIRQTKVCIVRENFITLAGGLHETLALNRCLNWFQNAYDSSIFNRKKSCIKNFLNQQGCSLSLNVYQPINQGCH